MKIEFYYFISYSMKIHTGVFFKFFKKKNTNLEEYLEKNCIDTKGFFNSEILSVKYKKIEEDLQKDINKLIDNEKKGFITTNINQSNENQSNETTVTEATIDSIKQQASFNMLKFDLSWRSSCAYSYYPLYKFTLLFNLCRKLGVLSYVTYQQEFLKLLYDGSYVLKNALQLQIYFAFNDLSFQSKDGKLDEEKAKKLKLKLFNIIELSELTGGCVVKLEGDEIDFLEKKDIKNEDFSYKGNKFPIASVNKPLSSTAKSFLPFGLSCFEDKMFIIESIIELERSRNEIMNKMIQVTLSRQILQNDFGDTATIKEKKTARNKAEEIAQAGNMSVVTLPDGWQLGYSSANIDLHQFIDVYNHLMMQLTGLPKEIFSGENLGQINIGSKYQEENVLLRCFKEKFRNNYNFFIKMLAKKYFGNDNVDIMYDDLKTISGVNEIKNINEVSDVMLKFSNIPDLQEELSDFARKILDKMKDKIAD